MGIGIHVVSFCLLLSFAYGKQAPNIVFIVGDDVGWADIGFHNPFIESPNIDNLAASGRILNQSYVQPLCTPSRNAFMSGLYPFKTGLQNGAIVNNHPVCLPVDKKLLPQYMKDLGYATHMVGKWHLGFCNWNCTPTYRGFDSFFGFYCGREDYYTHTVNNYTDFRDNKTPVSSDKGKYSANLLAERAVNIISDHNADQPLFLYVPFQSVHLPIQVPDEYTSRCTKIEDKERKQFCGMVAAMDEGVGNITQALKEKGLYNNTIVIFTADNGGIQQGSGYNYPLRGQKATIWEGGTRVVGFVHSPLLSMPKTTSNEMMHATDWFSTIIGLGGGEVPPDVDGIDQSDLILKGGASKRTEFIYNLDNTTGPIVNGHAGIRMGDYKLMIGLPGFPLFDQWFVPPEYGHKNIKVNERKAQEDQLYLFNLKDDPEERNNLYHKMPELVQKMRTRLFSYYEKMVPAQTPDADPNANPENFGGAWSPGWC